MMFEETEHDDLSLKPTLESVAKLIDADAALQISMDFGGTRIYIPHKPGEHSPLAVSIGLDAARKIAHIYGGMEFNVPVGLGKKAEIVKLNAEGKSVSEIARKLRCSASFVQRIRAEIASKDQLTLPF